ncbi:ABC transporter permease subunit [Rhodoligotrophos defluvii]|uniref:ABC transporter permease subunit n=1 Tax=Rhodoligotrophos defluvii TaxID=2561934 RepID=UPI0010C98145|nr:ABC transporter permease subunit [Rhodoligotrophos defluvii]
MANILAVTRRELASYFATPIAYVFLAIFVALAGVFTFYLGQFFDRGVADLSPFFDYHLWLYLLLVPAIAMRLWAEEWRSGTVELLMTLPVSTTEAVVGKWLAGWIFLGIALLCTVPLWITVNVLGKPDNGVIAAAYLGSFLMAGGFLAIGAAMSAVSRNQVIAFILAAVMCFLFVMSGTNLVLGALQGWAPQVVTAAVASLSALTHYTNMSRGLIGAADLVYVASLIAFWLFVNAVVVELGRAE